MTTQVSVKVGCANGHRRSTVARFATFNDPTVELAKWWPETGARETFLELPPRESAIVRQRKGGDVVRAVVRVSCPRCALILDARSGRLDAALTALVRAGHGSISLQDLIAATQ